MQLEGEARKRRARNKNRTTYVHLITEASVSRLKYHLSKKSISKFSLCVTELFFYSFPRNVSSVCLTTLDIFV